MMGGSLARYCLYGFSITSLRASFRGLSSALLYGCGNGMTAAVCRFYICPLSLGHLQAVPIP